MAAAAGAGFAGVAGSDDRCAIGREGMAGVRATGGDFVATTGWGARPVEGFDGAGDVAGLLGVAAGCELLGATGARALVVRDAIAALGRALPSASELE